MKIVNIVLNHLHQNRSNVFVKSILLDEEKHLQEMEKELKSLRFGLVYAQTVCAFEKKLFQKWMNAIKKEVS